ncbi:MAG: hypothetical protein A2018_05735 [Alphaproteobacteria bacterium GWF2_58_20]|nr:MAG: hypothetical protein A2018_05735 [Alphaproteobacteria bacterium GWF2_58_20]
MASEEAAKQALVMPFLALLGYDIWNPNEVKPEHNADFSEKYQNRVDYAILRQDEPVIAIECKNVGIKLGSNRGQLKSYFNALPSVKLGILTDGIIYEFYADSNSPNLMDDTPYITFDLREIAKGNIEDQVLDGIIGICKPLFNPDNVGSEAKKKLILNKIIQLMGDFSENAPDDFVRFILNKTEMAQRITQKMVEDYRTVVKEALQQFITQKILTKIGISQSELVKFKEQSEEESLEQAIIPSDIITTEQELAVFKYAQQRLAFLVKSDDLFKEIEKVQYRDFKTRFVVFYDKERRGSLFTYQEGPDNKHTFTFPALGGTSLVTEKVSDIDAPLLESFQKRLQEMKNS